jgi:hypothetical protein
LALKKPDTGGSSTILCPIFQARKVFGSAGTINDKDHSRPRRALHIVLSVVGMSLAAFFSIAEKSGQAAGMIRDTRRTL